MNHRVVARKSGRADLTVTVASEDEGDRLARGLAPKYGNVDRRASGVPHNLIPIALNRWLSTACEYAKAGFYFEEGGCLGMALALNDVFRRAGFKTKISKQCEADHVGVAVEGRFFDYQGFHTTCFTPMTRMDLNRISVEWGNTPDDVASDRLWASEIISTALELFEEHGLD